MQTQPLLSLLCLVAATLAGCGLYGAPTTPTAAMAQGDILVDAKGMSLYTFDRDIAGSGQAAGKGAGAGNGPPWRAATDAAPPPVVESVRFGKFVFQLASGELRKGEEVIPLTERERDVMRLVVEGLPNKLIADQLQISVRTVEVHRARVFEKMGVKSAVELSNLVRDSLA